MVQRPNIAMLIVRAKFTGILSDSVRAKFTGILSDSVRAKFTEIYQIQLSVDGYWEIEDVVLSKINSNLLLAVHSLVY